jgi:hypothetical protein
MWLRLDLVTMPKRPTALEGQKRTGTRSLLTAA